MNCLHCRKAFIPPVSSKYCSLKCRSRHTYILKGDRYRASASRLYYEKYDDYDSKRNSLEGKYTRQWRRAAERNIDWEFTFETWLAWWGPDIERRGCKRGMLVMARHKDSGPYSPGNCYKATANQNMSDSFRFRAERGHSGPQSREPLIVEVDLARSIVK